MNDETINIDEQLDILEETKEQIKQAIIEKGQEVSDEDSFRSYAEKIINIETGDIKLYETVEEMHQDEVDKEDGDLAVVYKKDVRKANNVDAFIGISFKETFTVPIAITQSYSYYYSPVSSTNNGSLNISISATSASISISKTNTSIYIQYTSTDGINYTFKSWREGDWMTGQTTYDTMQAEEFDYGFQIQPSANGSWYTWTDAFTELFNIIIYNFDGIYRFTENYTDLDTVKTYTNYILQQNPDTGNKQVYADEVSYINCKDIAQKMYELDSTIFPENSYMGSNISGLVYVKERFANGKPKKIIFYKSLTNLRKINGVMYLYNGTNSSIPSTPSTNTKYTLDLQNNTITTETLTCNYIPLAFGSNTYYANTYTVDFDVTTDEITACTFKSPISTSSSNVTNNIYLYEDYVDSSSSQYNSYGLSVKNANFNKFIYASTQFTLLKSNQIFDNLKAYSNKGTVEGDGSYLTNITNNNFKNTWLPNFDTSSSSSNYYDTTIYYGPQVQYQTFLDRSEITYEQMLLMNNTDNCVTRKDTKTVKTISVTSSSLLYKIYKSQQTRYNYFRMNDEIYWVYMGFNFNSTSSGDRTTLNNIYGVVYNLNTGELYKSVENTSAWRPFSSWSSQDCCDILSASYMPTVDKWVITLDTDGYGFSNGPYYGMIRIDGTTGSRSNRAVRLNKIGSDTYHKTNVDVYVPEDDTFYVTAYSDNTVYGVQRVDANGNVANVYTPRSRNIQYRYILEWFKLLLANTKTNSLYRGK